MHDVQRLITAQRDDIAILQHDAESGKTHSHMSLDVNINIGVLSQGRACSHVLMVNGWVASPQVPSLYGLRCPCALCVKAASAPPKQMPSGN